MRTHWIALISLLSLALGSCIPPQATDEDVQPLEPQLPALVDPLPTSSENTLPPLGPTQQEFPEASSVPSEKYVDIAKHELADLLNINIDQITVLNIMKRTWPNAALGCPAPGKVYAQGLVPGHRIWLEAGGKEYIYHTDLNGRIILCPELNPDDLNSLIPATPGPTQQIGVPID